ncbi:hypothetical protein [Leisingera methylohalidivorans]|uniref:DUF883 domain-containing protein n=1 Tax=Leisingera methylohalidivorans DSM 14336 TaxID=999552 RepID=V9VXS3_9RHOB|nr:hypothetical protein [Leisingera methylohalidivorans]AHD02519.1 hypothetical protein METH_19465 [Leisingera methylohalidivorans DSM 14336]
MTNSAETQQQTKGSTGSAAGNASGNLTGRVKEQAAQTVQQAQEQIDAGLQYSSGEMQRFAKEGQEFVKKNPGLAVAGALGAGVLLGLAMRSRF